MKHFRALLVLLLLTNPLFAQQTTGSLSGTVSDSSGATLPGVTVEVSSPALQGKKIAVTEQGGRYRFLNLPPGDDYRVVATLEGFETKSARGIHVFLGQEGTIHVILRPAVSEAITVTTETPLVDVTKTTTGLNITAKQFDTLPTRRNFQALAVMVPGVSLEMADSHPGRTGPFATSPAVGGASLAENNYIIEGLSTTQTLYGTSGTKLTMNFVEELQVLTGGYSAEFGRSTGGILNVVTKSGGNDIHGDLFAYLQDQKWSANNIRRRFRGTNTRADGVKNSDLGLSLGGPIVRDRLWFFAAYDPTRTTTFLHEFTDRTGLFVEENHEWRSKTNIFAGKLTWSVSPSSSLVATAFGDPNIKDGWLGGALQDPPVALRRSETGGKNFVTRYSASRGSKLVVEARAGRHEYHDAVQPSTDVGRTVPRQFDAVTGVTHGGFFLKSDELAWRNSASVKLTSFLGAHELLAGIDTERNQYDVGWNDHSFVFRGQRRINATIGRQDRLDEFIHTEDGFGRTDNLAGYLEDRWRVLPSLQLNLGLRSEIQRLSSANGAQIARGFGSDGKVHPEKVRAFRLDHNWAPRLGVIWDPRSNGKSKIYGYVGRYFEAIPLLINLTNMNGATEIQNRYYSQTRHSSNDWFNPAGSPLNNEWIRFRTINTVPNDAGARGPLDANLKAQYQDEFVIGGETQFASAWSAGVRLIGRRIGRVIEDFSVPTDPNDPLSLGEQYIIGNPGEGQFGGRYKKPRRDYRAVEVTLQRRQTNWQLFSSFLYARAKGDYEGLYSNTYNALAPNWTQAYDLPDFQVNAFGKLAADRPYQLKVHGSYSFPFRLTLSEAFLFSAGSPISAMGPEIEVGYGNGVIFLLPRGSQGRTPNYWTLDLHADYVLPLLNRRSNALSVIVDIFNAANNHQVLSVDENYMYIGMPGYDQWIADENLGRYGNPRYNANLPRSPYYKTPLVYQPPRFIQAGVKFVF
jgi:hypothetical protein